MTTRGPGGDPPDIVLFLTDDHARWALPVYGNPVVAMPNLERLAARGTVYEDAFTTSPVCSPARASLMTGLMPSAHGVHDFLASNPRFDARDWLAGLPTLAQKLSAAGYDCALVGKWHIGRDATPQAGFRSWFALDGEYPIHHDGDNGFSRDGVAERHGGNLTDAITGGALDFLARRDPERPLFLVVGYYATHSPWAQQPARLVARYADCDFAEIETGGGAAPGILNPEMPDGSAAARQEARAQYYAAATHIDEGVGTILSALEAEGTLGDTLVVYTADHGLALGQHGVWGKGNATRPQNMLDESVRIPLVMAGPGVAAGARVAGFVDHTDTHRYLLGAAGLAPRQPFPRGRAIQFAEYGTVRMARTATHKLLTWTTDAPAQLFAVVPGADETVAVTDAPGATAIASGLDRHVRAFFAGHADPSRSGPAALAPGTFNYNQAWDPFVPR
jgi:arylsulfatase A-like enzyme